MSRLNKPPHCQCHIERLVCFLHPQWYGTTHIPMVAFIYQPLCRILSVIQNLHSVYLPDVNLGYNKHINENECCFLRTVKFQMLTLLKKNLYRQSQYSKTWDSYRQESEGWGLESPSGRDIFCVKIVDTFTRTSVRVSKMNVVARAEFIFQMLNILQKYLYHQSQY